MKIILIILSFALYQIGAAQNVFQKMWDRRMGGDSFDMLYSIVSCNGGGYLFGGTSQSKISGDKTQDNWDSTAMSGDFWIVRVDPDGNILWDKRYGGIKQENLLSMCQTKDAGFILGGVSYSDVSGDKTQPKWGEGDYWVIKIDSQGNKQWDKRFGGSSTETLLSVKPARDEGYILGGYSFSGLDGDKSQPKWDTLPFGSDYWIVKIDSVGNKQWDKRYGGMEDDFFSSLEVCSDGGFLLAGTTYSGLSGDKSQNRRGSQDYWIIKIDSMGNKEWDKRFGNSSESVLYGVAQTSDSGFILVGSSGTGNNGDKSIVEGGLWLVKINKAGTKLWDRVYSEEAPILQPINMLNVTTDGGFLLACVSQNDAGGNKSEDNLGAAQSWILKTDASGVKEWDKTIFTTGTDQVAYAVESNDGCYVAGNYTTAGNGGYKTKGNIGLSDYWAMKFCMEPLDIGSVLADCEVHVSPNPFYRDISIFIQQAQCHQVVITLYNSVGQEVYHQKEEDIKSNYVKMLDLSSLTKGLYVLAVSTYKATITKLLMKY